MKELSSADFLPLEAGQEIHGISRPSQSYWQDAWARLKTNKRALVSLYLVIGLILFTVAGPWVWSSRPGAAGSGSDK